MDNSIASLGLLSILFKLRKYTFLSIVLETHKLDRHYSPFVHYVNDLIICYKKPDKPYSRQLVKTLFLFFENICPYHDTGHIKDIL